MLANWRIRNKGPEPLPSGLFRGNRTFYRAFEVERWLRSLEGEDLKPWEVVADWLRSRYIFPEPLETEERTWRVAEQLRGHNVLSIKHGPRRRTPLDPNVQLAAVK